MTRRRDADAHAFHEAWENGAPTDGEMTDLLRTAEMLCREASAAPSPDFRASLREELMAEAASVLVADPASLRARPPAPDPRTGRGRKRAAGVAAALVTSLGAVSMVASSASAIPGDVLHPVKLGVEQVQLSFKDQGAERGSFQLERASERLREAAALAEAGRASEVATSLQRFDQLAGEGSTALFADFTGAGRTESVEEVNAFVADATDVLTGLEPDDAYAAQWDEAARSLSSLALESSRLCARCATPAVDALVRSVTAAAQDQTLQDSGTRETTAPPAAPAATRAPSRAATGTEAPPAPSSSSPATGTTPRPAPSASSPPRLSDVTDPLLGPILGNSETEGLIPSLLGGLLGSPRG